METEFKACKKCEEGIILCDSCAQNKKIIDLLQPPHSEARIQRLKSIKTRCCDCIGHIPVTSTLAFFIGDCALVLNAYGDPINVTEVRGFDQECRLFKKKE